MATFVISVLEKEFTSYNLECPGNHEALLNVGEIIRYWKYPFEEHDVETADSYILTLHRIPHGRAGNKVSGQRPVVFLQHGLFSSSVSWVSSPPNNSLAFILANAGFDVWMGNSRGSTYSLKHATLSRDSAEYWAFSFDEMAIYDLPASVDYVVEKTGQKIYYVGHSQGTLIAFVAFSILPQLALNIKSFYALAPVFYFQHPKPFLVELLSMISEPIFKFILGNEDILPWSNINKFLATKVCNNEITKAIYSRFIFSLCGFDPQSLNMSRFDVYMAHHPTGASSQNIVHYHQIINEIQIMVRAYNWGNTRKNMAHYNQSTPPRYNLSTMQVPTALWSGQRDLLTEPSDSLVPQIPNLIYHKILPTYNHIAFVFGINAPQDIYYDIIKMMKETSGRYW